MKAKFLVLFLVIILLITNIAPVLSQSSVTKIENLKAIELADRGEQNYRAGNYLKAAELLQEAITIFKSQADWQNLAITLTNLGRLQLVLGTPKLALQSWQEAEAIYQQPLQDEIGIVRSRIYQAKALEEIGLDRNACFLLIGALNLAANDCLSLNKTAIEERFLDSNYWNSIKLNGWVYLANVLRSIGKLEESELILKKIIAIPITSNSAANLIALANTIRAEGNLVKDLEAAPKYDYIPWRCSATNNIPDRALQFYQQAEQLYQQASARSNSLNTKILARLNRLSLPIEISQTNPAWLTEIKQLLSAIDLDTLPLSKTTVLAKVNLARNIACFQQIENNSLEYQKIVNLLDRAYQDALNLNNPTLQSIVLGNLGGLYEYSARQSQNTLCQTALACRKQAEKLTSSALLLTQSSLSPQIAYQWEWQLARILAAEGERNQAIAAYDRAIATLNKLRNDLISINSDVQFSFRDNVEPIYRQAIDLLLTEENKSQFTEKALEIIDFLRIAELENFLQCDLAGNLQAERLVGEIDSKAAFIYPVILSSRLEVIFKLPERPLSHVGIKIDPNEVERTVADLQYYLPDFSATEEVKQEAAKIYNWLIQPIETELENLKNRGKIDTLVFVLDDSLRNIPMSVLYHNGKYLIEKYAVAIIPNRQLFNSSSRQKKLNVLTGGISEKQEVDGIEFAPLTYVPQELSEIRQLTDSEQQPFLNQEFTQINLEKEINNADFSILHIATHGQFSSDPNETYILFWNERIKAREFDRILQISNRERKAKIELLILSACETALGNRRAVLGLAGIAARARVRTTIATLWQVNDRATAEFMLKFYRELTRGRTIAEAMRITQLYFLSDIDGKRPYFWAPFTIVGNWL